MMNIGNKPTVNGTEQSIEVHWFDVDENLYDFSFKIELLERLRDERKFESLEALKIQLKKDQQHAWDFIKHYV